MPHNLTILFVITEKFWIKTWGEAYGDDANASVSYALESLFSSNQQISLDGMNPIHVHANPHHLLFAQKLGVQLPSAYKHPLFYVGIYAAIGVGNALVEILGIIAQYTGALRASRRLFRRLLETVVRCSISAF